MNAKSHNREMRLRTVADGDEAFLYRVYASTRQEELAALDWDAAARDSFLRMQFAAQDKYYRETFTGAAFQVILVDGEPAGRLYVDRREDEVRIIDIALLPERRAAGIGTAIVCELLAEAQAAGKPVRIHVERFNPALRLYERLGFRRTGDTGVYYLMEWQPAVR